MLSITSKRDPIELCDKTKQQHNTPISHEAQYGTQNLSVRSIVRQHHRFND
jgi:hypothetical protein